MDIILINTRPTFSICPPSGYRRKMSFRNSTKGGVVCPNLPVRECLACKNTAAYEMFIFLDGKIRWNEKAYMPLMQNNESNKTFNVSYTYRIVKKYMIRYYRVTIKTIFLIVIYMCTFIPLFNCSCFEFLQWQVFSQPRVM